MSADCTVGQTVH